MSLNEYSFNAMAAKIGHSGENELLKRILVPVDFSPCAENAIRFAVAIALRTGAEMKLFHSVQVPLQSAEMTVYPIQELEKEAESRLGELVGEMNAWCEGEQSVQLKVAHQVAVGFAAEEIAVVAKKDQSDLIVMGTHGTGAIEGILLGSNSTAVLERVECPTLLVPEKATFDGFGRIVYASDMQELNTKAVKVLTQFASHFDSELHVLHVLSGNDNLTPEQASIFKEQFSGAANYPSLSYHILDAGDKSVSASIEEFMDSNGASAVALVTHHRSFFDKLFHPSLTKRLAVHAHKPLLAFHG